MYPLCQRKTHKGKTMSETPRLTLFEILEATAPTSLSLDQMPTDEQSRIIAIKAQELVDKEAEIAKAEIALDKLKRERHELAARVLPELMDQAQTDNIGVPASNTDIKLVQEYHASIKADWPDERREAAFEHLRELDAEELITANVTLTFPRDHFAMAERFASAAREWLNKARTNSVRIDFKQTVHHGTLTAFVRDYVQTPIDLNAPPRVSLDFDKLGATAHRICKVIPRQGNPSKRASKSPR
jgi:hypothetical protein